MADEAEDILGIPAADVMSRRRTQNVALIRQAIMWLMRRNSTASLQEIGRIFHNRNHGTVIHACHKIEDMLAEEARRGEGTAVADLLEALRKAGGLQTATEAEEEKKLGL